MSNYHRVSSAREQGVVLRFEKCFGFIKLDTGGRDIFVHISELRAAGLLELRGGTRIEYALGKDRTGRLEAIELKVVNQ
jgi:cold shock protein